MLTSTSEIKYLDLLDIQILVVDIWIRILGGEYQYPDQRSDMKIGYSDRADLDLDIKFLDLSNPVRKKILDWISGFGFKKILLIFYIFFTYIRILDSIFDPYFFITL